MSTASVRRRWMAAGGLVAIIFATALWLHFGGPPASFAPPAETATTPSAASAPNPVETRTSVVPSPTPPPPITVMPTAAELGATIASRDDPSGALRGVDQAIYFYRQAMGENPVGQNEDITAALLGENSAHAAFLPPDSPAIKDGKLLDQWKTPYWFHPLSGRQMEIRSAGPDRELFTDDDLIVGK